LHVLGFGQYHHHLYTSSSGRPVGCMSLLLNMAGSVAS
jgi:hypothetical protein